MREKNDFHARPRFARSTIPEENWGLLVVYSHVFNLFEGIGNEIRGHTGTRALIREQRKQARAHK